MIDLHCHVLPGIDDGPTSWEIAVEMCRIAAEDGIRHIVATPHANERYHYDRSRCQSMLFRLEKISSTIKFSLGCDFYFSFDNVTDAVLHPQRYTIADSRYLLVELSDFSSMPAVKEGLFRLVGSGITPIITHPERNLALLETPETVLELVRYGCLVQVTGNSFNGYWGARSQRMAEWLLKQNAIHVIASDAHDPANRPPVLSKTFDRVYEMAGQDVAHALFVDNPAAIVSAKTTVRPTATLP